MMPVNYSQTVFKIWEISETKARMIINSLKNSDTKDGLDTMFLKMFNECLSGLIINAINISIMKESFQEPGRQL